MKRKIVRTGSSLAVTLPADVVHELGLRKGDEVEVSVHPQSRAVIVRASVTYVDGGKVTKRFDEVARRVLKRHSRAFRELAK